MHLSVEFYSAEPLRVVYFVGICLILWEKFIWYLHYFRYIKDHDRWILMECKIHLKLPCSKRLWFCHQRQVKSISLSDKYLLFTFFLSLLGSNLKHSCPNPLPSELCVKEINQILHTRCGILQLFVLYFNRVFLCTVWVSNSLLFYLFMSYALNSASMRSMFLEVFIS